MVLDPACAARAPIPTRFRILDRAASGWQVGPRGRFCRNLAARPVCERMQKRPPYRYVTDEAPFSTTLCGLPVAFALRMGGPNP
jgi:hypothetical protein